MPRDLHRKLCSIMRWDVSDKVITEEFIDCIKEIAADEQEGIFEGRDFEDAVGQVVGKIVSEETMEDTFQDYTEEYITPIRAVVDDLLDLRHRNFFGRLRWLLLGR